MRLELSKRSDLAIRALSCLAQNEDHGLVDGKTLADWLDTSTNYLPQVMSPLARAGWVRSVPGPGGGYVASQSLGEVSVLEVIDVIEGPLTEDICVLSGAPCPVQVECALHRPWTRARDALLAELGNTTLTEVMQPCSTQRGG
jgi:Rrf2 family protein